MTPPPLVEAADELLGGHFGDSARLVRVTARTGADPGARRPFIGFRVAISRMTPRT